VVLRADKRKKAVETAFDVGVFNHRPQRPC
jgi:hypothetical protein